MTNYKVTDRINFRPCSHGYRYRTVPLRSVSKSGTEKGCVHTGTEKNQAVRSRTGPEIGRYLKVNQKLERYDIVPFRSGVNRESGQV